MNLECSGAMSQIRDARGTTEPRGSTQRSEGIYGREGGAGVGEENGIIMMGMTLVKSSRDDYKYVYGHT